MTTDPASLGHVRRFRCGRRRNERTCYVPGCGATAAVLCDYPREDLTDEERAEITEAVGKYQADAWTLCSRPCCKRHAAYWKGGKDVCRDHAKQLGITV